jgi:hypothetical protein
LSPYSKQTWLDGSAAHPASAARFESGLDAAADVADSARSSINAHAAALTTTAPRKISSGGFPRFPRGDHLLAQELGPIEL